MLKIFKSIFKVREEMEKGGSKKLLNKELFYWATAEDAVNDIFKKMDANNDNKISFEEWSTVCIQDESILNSMSLFNSYLQKS